MAKADVELGPLSDVALLMIANGLEIPNAAAIRSMQRELDGSDESDWWLLARAVRRARALSSEAEL